MPEPKTKVLDADVQTFFAGVEPERRRLETPKLDAVFQRATGFKPRIWSGGMVGYGSYDYTYNSGRKGTWFATGFAPRKAKLSIYIMPGYTDYSGILDRLGKHSIGKACLYANKLADLDEDVLEELIRAGVKDLSTSWPVSAT